MFSVWNKDEKNNITIDLSVYGIYGKEDSFDLFYKYLDDDKLTKSDDSFKELLEDIGDGITTKVSKDTDPGSTKLALDDTSNITKGMRFKIKDKDIWMYVIDVDDTYIYLRQPLSAEVKKGNEINQVGNTGAYEIQTKFSNPGIITILVQAIEIELDFDISKIKVVDKSAEDILNLMNQIETGKMEIKDNKLKYYNNDGDVIASFKLYNKDGDPTEIDVYKRVPE